MDVFDKIVGVVVIAGGVQEQIKMATKQQQVSRRVTVDDNVDAMCGKLLQLRAVVADQRRVCKGMGRVGRGEGEFERDR